MKWIDLSFYNLSLISKKKTSGNRAFVVTLPLNTNDNHSDSSTEFIISELQRIGFQKKGNLLASMMTADVLRQLKTLANVKMIDVVPESVGYPKKENSPSISNKESNEKLEKLLLSAISNWQKKNENSNVEDAGLFISEIKVDSGSMLKRLRTAPQGRAHRIRKRSNHVTIVLGSKNNDVQTN